MSSAIYAADAFADLDPNGFSLNPITRGLDAHYKGGVKRFLPIVAAVALPIAGAWLGAAYLAGMGAITAAGGAAIGGALGGFAGQAVGAKLSGQPFQAKNALLGAGLGAAGGYLGAQAGLFGGAATPVASTTAAAPSQAIAGQGLNVTAGAPGVAAPGVAPGISVLDDAAMAASAGSGVNAAALPATYSISPAYAQAGGSGLSLAAPSGTGLSLAAPSGTGFNAASAASNLAAAPAASPTLLGKAGQAFDSFMGSKAGEAVKSTAPYMALGAGARLLTPEPEMPQELRDALAADQEFRSQYSNPGNRLALGAQREFTESASQYNNPGYWEQFAGTSKARFRASRDPQRADLERRLRSTSMDESAVQAMLAKFDSDSQLGEMGAYNTGYTSAQGAALGNVAQAAGMRWPTGSTTGSALAASMYGDNRYMQDLSGNMQLASLPFQEYQRRQAKQDTLDYMDRANKMATDRLYELDRRRG